MYLLLRRILFSLPPEVAHNLSLKLLRYVPQAFFGNHKGNSINVMGINFPHRIGLAAGFDKNGEYLDALSKLGFSFIEVGTVTPKAQVGNAKPRLFRLLKDEALINRMGFNNHGVNTLVANIQKTNYQGILGINIGKNKDTPLIKAVDDYSYCLRIVYKYASYVTINISSPNTKELRKLQEVEYLENLIYSIRVLQLELADKYQRYVPLALKISPDETDEVLKNISAVVLKNKIDAIITTNTSLSRDYLHNSEYKNEAGGLSGKPIFQRSTNCLSVIKSIVGNDVALIGVGGIDGLNSAQEKLKAGASLLQVYTGLIYNGPQILSAMKLL